MQYAYTSDFTFRPGEDNTKRSGNYQSNLESVHQVPITLLLHYITITSLHKNVFIEIYKMCKQCRRPRYFYLFIYLLHTLEFMYFFGCINDVFHCDIIQRNSNLRKYPELQIIASRFIRHRHFIIFLRNARHFD